MLNYKNIFLGAFSGTSGFLTAYMIVGLYSFILFSIGFYLILRYNKKNTDILKEIQPLQYLGIVFCFLSMLPFAQYFFMGFLQGAGSYAFERLLNN